MKQIAIIFSLLLSMNLKAQVTHFYVGSATSEIPEPITLCSIDLSTGKIKKIKSFGGSIGSSYLAISPKQDYLYAVSTDKLDAASENESVASFKIDKKTKDLSLISKQSVEGKGVCHVSVTSNNKVLMVANYTSGNVVALPINKDGGLEPVASNNQHSGTLGPDTSRQEAPHAHYIQSSPDDRFVFGIDLGIDKVMNYSLDVKSVKLTANPNQAFLKMEPGAGPRHMVFHPNGKNLFVLNELNSTISACTYDVKSGVIKIIETHAMLPSDFSDYSKAAAIRIHPSGKFLYGSNRGHDSIAVFEILSDGNIKRTQIIQDGSEWTRDFNIEASGQFMIVANRWKNEIRVYNIDQNGQLSMTENTLEIAQPTCVTFFN